PMVNAYNLLHEGRRLGLAYIAPHPAYPDHLLVSVIPLERTGKWEDPSLGIHFETPCTTSFRTPRLAFPSHRASRACVPTTTRSRARPAAATIVLPGRAGTSGDGGGRTLTTSPTGPPQSHVRRRSRRSSMSSRRSGLTATRS